MNDESTYLAAASLLTLALIAVCVGIGVIL